MTASSNANYNDAASEVSSLLYFLDHNYEVKESEDPRFIVGRQASICIKGKSVGVFGEINPQVLENWSITVPCFGGEIDLEEIMALEPESKTEPNQSEQKQKSEPKPSSEKSDAPKLAENQVQFFNENIELKVAVIKSVECNPAGDKLYIETMDDGSGTDRIIQSGLRPYLKPEELLGQHVIIASNLAPRKMKGVESRGMLLACDYIQDGTEKVELLTAPRAPAGTPVILEGADENFVKPEKINIDKFCKVQMQIKDFTAVISGTKLTAQGKPITTQKSNDCEIC